MTSILVGLAVGNGTGSELAAVFEHVIQALATPFGLHIAFVRPPRNYHSYSSLLAINDTDAVTKETIIDAAEYHKFCEHAIDAGVSAIFYTSISSLYMVFY
ncbi:hypothetical protein BDV41DRAFT_577631 [Aspergillus transmontanensis]|uniref:NmrA-like domain-containing protein n=1 Tax=Aspergillus transmontanensis TaxID=1034304 RepID=A0A5N6VVQ6_9EURO|nr:hypothetical protein BDV41DRAFT_577631 [Aspergillus transmontanensis]